VPLSSWIKRIVQRLAVKKENKPSPGNKSSALELSPQLNKAKSKKQTIAAKNPQIAPWTRKGPLTNQFEAPTNF